MFTEPCTREAISRDQTPRLEVAQESRSYRRIRNKYSNKILKLLGRLKKKETQ